MCLPQALTRTVAKTALNQSVQNAEKKPRGKKRQPLGSGGSYSQQIKHQQDMMSTLVVTFRFAILAVLCTFSQKIRSSRNYGLDIRRPTISLGFILSRGVGEVPR